MSKKRIRKKRAVKVERELVCVEGQSSPLYAIRSVVVTVPCPTCGHGTMDRRYLPAIGGMNGTVSCPRCQFSASYLEALAMAMRAEDPLPAPLTPVRPSLPAAVALAADAHPWRAMMAEAVWVLSVIARQLLGIRRRWRFASA